MITTDNIIMTSDPRSGLMERSILEPLVGRGPVSPMGYKMEESSHKAGRSGQCPVRRHASDVRGKTTQAKRPSTMRMAATLQERRNRFSTAMDLCRSAQGASSVTNCCFTLDDF